MINQPNVAIIVTTFNQKELLFDCLDSLKKNTNYKNYNLYFVDDSGKGEIGREVKKKYKWVDVTINEKNGGFSKANNIGIKRAIKNFNPDYILLINDDCEVKNKNWLSKIVKVGEKNERAGVLGCKLIYEDGSLQWVVDNFSNIHFFSSPGKKNILNETVRERVVDNIVGAFFLIKREVIERIGLLDEIYSPFYGEETDFCYRAKKAGYDNLYVPGINTIHKRNSSISKKENNYVWYIKKRNSIIFEWRYFGMLRNIKHTFLHFASTIYNLEKKKFNSDFGYKIYLLFKAYINTLKNFKEIKKEGKK